MASPTPSQSDTVTTNSTSSDSEMETVVTNTNIRCPYCMEPFSMPKVLSCFHTFCQPCLEKMTDASTFKVHCHICKFDTYIGDGGLPALKTNYAVINMIEATQFEPSTLHCRSCKGGTASEAVSRCIECANFLCSNCTMAHRFMHCFNGHRVVNLSELANKEDDGGGENLEKAVSCPDHVTQKLAYYCRTCRVPICKDCDHREGHQCVFLSDVTESEVGQLKMMEEETYKKAAELRANANIMAHVSSLLKRQYAKAQMDIDQTFTYFHGMLEERKKEAMKQLDEAFNSKQVAISDTTLRMHESVDKLGVAGEFISRALKSAAPVENLLLKGFIESRLQNIFNFLPDVHTPAQFDLEFVSNFQAIEAAVRNTFGYVRQGYEYSESRKVQPIARPNGYHQQSPTVTSNGNFTFTMPPSQPKEPTMDLPAAAAFFTSTDNGQYEKWSNGLDLQAASPPPDVFSTSADPVLELTSKMSTISNHPPKSNIRRQKMIYHHRFGEFGMREAQFTEPSGVTTDCQDNIVVADTNNHRIQIFDKDGRFKFQFGESGKRDGQMLYPNRVAVVKSTGDIIVTERSPTHQVQIYNKWGQFVRKFGANILQHPRGVAVDSRGRIVIVECKVMRVLIFDMDGNVLNKFGCSKHLQFPNSVVVNDNEEIFISDNRAHCVKVFNYAGIYLRQIGGEGITNYPIGVGINSRGEVLVADNHNNFNITTFTQDGQLLSALESKVKHAQCFDVALMSDGSVVLASKDYKLYIYKYM
ncbi:hypothetical protein BaRGS_00012184 [Batillaria attramentaria]|uniref:Brain tumor protein n=1 Tax=Batillaria attramentaria TaxID=370345 RepID=A0ABD0LAI1_9CAEN|nr:hypothetical protein BaRGS_026112 [Batillaria attramentaria]